MAPHLCHGAKCADQCTATIFLVYTDDTIPVGPDEKEIEKIVNILSKNFKVEDQGDLSDYLGVNIERRKDGKIEMTQPTLTLSILKDVGLWENGKKNQATSRTTPAYSTTILTSDEGGEDFKDKDFNYRQVIGKLLYLEKSTRPDIACAVGKMELTSAALKYKNDESSSDESSSDESGDTSNHDPDVSDGVADDTMSSKFDPIQFPLLNKLSVKTEDMNRLVQEVLKLHGNQEIIFMRGNNRAASLVALPSHRTLERIRSDFSKKNSVIDLIVSNITDFLVFFLRV